MVFLALSLGAFMGAVVMHVLNWLDGRGDQARMAFGWPGARTSVADVRRLRERAESWMLIAAVITLVIAIISAFV